jgi:AcrR family transcriptional regulator
MRWPSTHEGKFVSTERSENSVNAAKRRRSLATRQDIIDATISCFIEIGYFRTTTTEIAKKASVTRGAVQHYFPTTNHVLQASIDHLQDTWLQAYLDAIENTPPGRDSIDFAVDNLWTFVNDQLYVAWQELVAASRTDKELRDIIEPAAARYEQARRDVVRTSYPEFREADQQKFSRNREMMQFLLEGMSFSILTYDAEARVRSTLDGLKEVLHQSWEPETSDHTIELKSK